MTIMLACTPNQTPDLLRSAMSRVPRRRAEPGVPRRRCAIPFLSRTSRQNNYVAEKPSLLPGESAVASGDPQGGGGGGSISPQNNYVAEDKNWGRNQSRGPRKAGAPRGNRNAAVSPEVAAIRQKTEDLRRRVREATARAKILIAELEAARPPRKTVLVYEVIRDGVLVRRKTIEFGPAAAKVTAEVAA
jgi:hypothetical protein